MNAACPRCASLETLSLPRIQREGLGALRTLGAGSGTGGFIGQMEVGTASAPRRGRSHSLLSRRISPPGKRSVSGWLLLAIVSGLFFLLSLSNLGVATLAYLGLAGLSTWRVQANRAYNTAALPRLLSRWEQSFLCNRCGEIFEPSQAGSARADRNHHPDK